MTDDAVLERLLAEWLDCEPHETVESFIDRHAEHATLLQKHFAMQDLVEQAFDPTPAMPERVGTFRIEAELGTGGMGTVYRAVTEEEGVAGPAGTTVALKLMHPHLFRSRGFFKRFLREADLGRKIAHPNVVRTLDVDAVEQDGTLQHFLVMEYVEGQTLRAMLDDIERAPEELARHLGIEIGKALAAIHEAGAVHRDLKPENVLITLDQHVKVMDLGVAQLVDEQVRLSRTGAFVGSLQYAAPEQFRSGSEVDARADLHGLGLLLYELCTGESPYFHEDVHVAMQRILSEEPRRLGERNPQISPFMEEFVHQLLRKDPEERFASAPDLLAALEVGEESEWWRERAKSLRQSTARPLRRIRIPRETALYGREEELARLHTLYEKAKAGDGQVLLIEGEAGIGKTRLVDEFVGRLRQEGEDLNFLFASNPPGGAATASGAFSRAYREHLGEEGLEATLTRYLPQTPMLVLAFAAILRGDVPPPDAQPLTKEAIQTCVAHLTRSLAAERPTVVLIDDLHFAPEEGRALFTSLALAAPDHAILLLGTTRPGLPEDWKANLCRLDQASPLVLPRLGPKDLVRLLGESLRSERLAQELAGKIAVKSDGNPFFVLEIVQGLREGQFLARKPDGTWHTTQLIKDIEVPSSVLDLVNARVANLEAEERDLLDVAACWGYEFDPLLVGGVVGLEAIPVLKTLGRIERAHRLIRASGRNYVFDHHQVQEALYGTLHERLRETYHARLAETLEAQTHATEVEPAALEGDLCVDLCHQFVKGAEGERALRYLKAAQEHLERSDLPARAVELVGCALAVPGLLTGSRRAEVLLRLARPEGALERVGHVDELREAARELGELDETLGDGARSVDAAVAIAGALQATNELDEAEAVLRRAQDRAGARGDARAEAWVLKSLGDVYRNSNRLEKAQEVLERAVDLLGDIDAQTEHVVDPRPNLGNVLALRGQLEGARRCFEDHLALARSRRNLRSEAWAMGSLGLLHWSEGRLDEARTCVAHQVEFARSTGRRGDEMLAMGNLAGILGEMGNLLDAEALCERLLLLARDAGSVEHAACAHVNHGPICLAWGAIEEASRHLSRALVLSRQGGLAWLEAYALQGLAGVADERGDGEGALRLANEALALRRRIGRTLEVPTSLAQIGDLLRRSGEETRAREVLEESLVAADEQENSTQQALALARLAVLGERRPDEVRGALGAATSSGERMEVYFLLWQAVDDANDLSEAKRQLDLEVARLPAEYHDSMLKNVRLHREIMEAWADQGEKCGGGE